MSTSVLIGIPDLLFSSKVNAVARQQGIPVVATFTKHDLLSKAHGETPSILILDLNADALAPLESVTAMKSDPHTRGIAVVGFQTRIDEALRTSAEEAGCDLVLSRSQFIEALPDILRGKLFKH